MSSTRYYLRIILILLVTIALMLTVIGCWSAVDRSRAIRFSVDLGEPVFLGIANDDGSTTFDDSVEPPILTEVSRREIREVTYELPMSR